MKVEVVINQNRDLVYFILLEDVVVKGYCIPKGFETDFASVPKSLWNILPPLGKHNRASLLHDFLYVNNINSRKYSDHLFLCTMLEDGVNKIKAYLMYFGVRLGGQKWWNHKGKKRVFKA